MLKIKILSASGTILETEIEAAFLPSVMGEFEVLPHHAPLIAMLCEGDVKIRQKDGKEEKFHIHSGIARVENDTIIVSVE